MAGGSHGAGGKCQGGGAGEELKDRVMSSPVAHSLLQIILNSKRENGAAVKIELQERSPRAGLRRTLPLSAGLNGRRMATTDADNPTLTATILARARDQPRRGPQPVPGDAADHQPTGWMAS